MEARVVGVAGLGLLGRGIVACLLARGVRVVGFDPQEKSRRAAEAHIEKAIGELVERASFPAERLTGWRKDYVEAKSVGEFASCDFVTESIFEDLDAKRALYDEIEAAVGADVPVA